VSSSRAILPALFAAVGIVLLQARAEESSDYLLDSWTSDNDLPDTSVTAVTQTPDGYLWIGTHYGLARFERRSVHDI